MATTTSDDKIRTMCHAVQAIVGIDGTHDVRTIVECALADDAEATAAEIAEIVREAREEAGDE